MGKESLKINAQLPLKGEIL